MQQELRRDLGLPQAMLTVIGIIIGSGIFAVPAVVFAQARAPGLGLFAWLLGGLITLAAGLSVSELTASMPRAGGAYVFLREAYGDWVAFLQGWAYLLTYNSALNAALAIIFTSYLGALVQLSRPMQIIVGIGLIALLSGINALGVRFGGLVQVATTVGKLVPIGLLILFGLLRSNPTHLVPLLPEFNVGHALAAAVLPILWAYDGWMHVGMLAEEVKNPQRNLPLAFVGGLSVAALVYVAFNAALLAVTPIHVVTASEKPVIPMATALFGSQGATLITIGMLVSMLGTLNALVMTAPRYYFAMARDGLFPAAKQVATLHPKHQTPVLAIVISAVISSLLLVSGRFEQMINLAVFVSWIFNTLTIAAVIVLRRKRPDLPRPYRCWGYPVVPLVGIAAGLWILSSLLQTDPKMAAIGSVITLLGLPAYAWLRRGRTETAKA